MGELIFDDIFKVQRVNPDGKKYDKVTRIEARSEKCDMFMQLDVNTEIYPIDKEERFLVALSTTLSLECGDSPLSFCFLELFRISNDKEHYMVYLMKLPNGVLYWDMKFLLAVQDWEMESLFNFMDITYGVSLRGIGEGGQKSLADKFEYIMHGKLYKISDEPEAKTLDGSSGPGVTVDIYVSFGGLQLMLKGDPSHCGGFELDQKLFLLMRKLT
uniref:Uncharacterized protein n=1 Tax=Quercus lobata TaxID=97700 RepID=A0A7N2R751_QUELO